MSTKQKKTKETKPKTRVKEDTLEIVDEPVKIAEVENKKIELSDNDNVNDDDNDDNDDNDDVNDDNDDDDEGDDDDQDEPDDEPDEDEPSRKTKTVNASRINNNKKDKSYKNTIHVSVPVEDKNRRGKTYKQHNNNNFNNHNNNNENNENKGSILRFSYIDAIKKNGSLKLSECDEESIFKYLIAMTHQSGKNAVCRVLKNTLTGMNGETNLPMLTVDRVPRYNNNNNNNNNNYTGGYNTNRQPKKYLSNYNNHNHEE